MGPVENALLLGCAVLALLLWYLADLRYDRKWSLKRAELGAQNRWQELNAEVPSRSAKYETHQGAGRAYLLLGRHEAAVAELRCAGELALHPIEKHSTNYWLARAAAAAGQSQEAARFFNLVAADGFGTWMSADAQARVSSSWRQ